jgi:hypothetical protein
MTVIVTTDIVIFKMITMTTIVIQPVMVIIIIKL